MRKSDRLAIEYAQNPSDDIREQIQQLDRQRVVSIVKRLELPQSIDRDDLISEGMIGLDKALKNFRLDLKVSFGTYSYAYIVGEIKHYIRDFSKTVHHPAWINEWAYKISRVSAQFESSKGKLPTNEELALALKVDITKLENAKKNVDIAKLTSNIRSTNELSSVDDIENKGGDILDQSLWARADGVRWEKPSIEQEIYDEIAYLVKQGTTANELRKRYNLTQSKAQTLHSAVSANLAMASS
jgi:RNA polymerase sigma factor (sigma-70 family)